MRKRIFRGASFILLALSLPAIGWSLTDSTETTVTPKIHQETFKTVPVVEEVVSANDLFDQHISEIYEAAGLKSLSLNYEVFKKALTGYYNLKSSNAVSSTKQVISIVDFAKPSTAKRLWIVDLASRKVLFNTYVAHGQGSGNNFATSFSNVANSHQSSLGFYVTSHTYFGKHGLSLKLNGMDKGYNSNALSRAVVVHGADYVSESFINQHGRLGRSHGCPAVPAELSSTIIETIKGKTTLFINGPAERNYSSNYLDENLAASNYSAKSNTEAVL